MSEKWIIHKKEVPETVVLEDYIYRHTDIIERIKNIHSASENYLKIPISYPQNLKNSVLLLLQKYQAQSYVTPNLKAASSNFKAIPFTYNPLSKSQSLSSPIPLSNISEVNDHALSRGKNSDRDTLSINTLSPIIDNTELRKFLSHFNRSIIRSKIVTHHAEYSSDDVSSLKAWHTDGSIFFNFRILIPLVTSENFGVEFMTSKSGSDEISYFSFENNFLYAFDTSKPHRYHCKRKSDEVRIGLVVGICPWFDYDIQNDSWSSNEFYGKMHPFEMLKQGHILPFNLEHF